MELQGTFSGGPALGLGENFHIDDLLDFSHEDMDLSGPIGDGFLSCMSSGSMEMCGGLPGTAGHHMLSAKNMEENMPENTNDTLCVPCDDIADLEWLSKFVEDSYEEATDCSPPRCGPSSAGSLYVTTDQMIQLEDYTESFEHASPVSVLESTSGGSRKQKPVQFSGPGSACLLETSTARKPKPARARSKRPFPKRGNLWQRANAKLQFVSSLPSTLSSAGAPPLPSNDTESFSSDSTVLTGGSSPSVCVDSLEQEQVDLQQQQQFQLLRMTPPKAVTVTKKPWKTSKCGKKGGQEAAQPWRCFHCQTQRTPQWRAGPMGPKTLCNACGVRYKSGRLLPEYRPAGSPGYIGHKHSNSHKKILEMRKQREAMSNPNNGHHQSTGHHQNTGVHMERIQQYRFSGSVDQPTLQVSMLSPSSCQDSSLHGFPGEEDFNDLEEDPAGSICTSPN